MAVTTNNQVHLQLLGNGSSDPFIGVYAVPGRLPELLRYPGESAQAFCNRVLHHVTGTGAIWARLMYANERGPMQCITPPPPPKKYFQKFSSKNKPNLNKQGLVQGPHKGTPTTFPPEGNSDRVIFSAVGVLKWLGLGLHGGVCHEKP